MGRDLTTPSPHHPIGAKGVGESPNVGGVSAFSNAVNDAFAHLGLTHTAMPHDHWRVWRTAQSLGLTDAALLGLLVGVRGFEPPAPASRKAMVYFADSIDSEFPLTNRRELVLQRSPQPRST